MEGSDRCLKCGRSNAAAAGGLDLLNDSLREEADRFAAAYTALRKREGWIGITGREDPDGGRPKLWRGRVASVSEAAAAMSRDWAGGERRVVLDIGSGGGWAARYVPGADVIAIDLLDTRAIPGVMQVRADMRSLPVRDASVDAALYAASLHYAPVEGTVHEAARVLRPGGLMVAVDSPMYPDLEQKDQALARSTTYYASAGFPELTAHYHPIDVTELRAALAGAGFAVLRLDFGRPARRWWQRAGPHRSFLLARLALQL